MGVAVDPVSKRAAFIKSVGVFRRLRTDEAERVARSAEVQRLERRAILWESGRPAERVYLVRSGVVKIHQPLDGGREFTFGFYGKGELIGEDALLVPGPRQTQCSAYAAAEVHALPLHEVRQRAQELGFDLARLVAERRSRVERRLPILLFRTATARLSSLLLELCESFGVRDSRGTIINLKLTHKELAGLIGATRETVSFAIVDLRKRGFVVTEGKRVVVLDAAGLSRLAAG